MHRQPLLNLLRQHVSERPGRYRSGMPDHGRCAGAIPAGAGEPRTATDAAEQAMTWATIAFVEQYPDCFERSLLIGHVTGSAWIVSSDRQHVVLIHHRKLNRWLQPGGHADGDPDVAAVALREAGEETGLTSLRLVIGSDELPPIFDIDVHGIPARGEVPGHRHYDIRFLVEADPAEPFGVSDEVEDIRWFPVENVKHYTDSESIWRMIRKIVKN